MLVMADQSGLVPSTAPGISKAAAVPLDITVKAIETLEKPDEYSKSADNDGCRIKRVNGGYLILNYEKYREYSYSLDDRAVYMREYRSGKRKIGEGYIYFARDGNRIKIGFSKNPHARIYELKSTNPEIELIGYYNGTLADETKLHKKYESQNIAREWFRESPELLSEISSYVAITTGQHSASVSLYDMFSLFWKEYPRKVNKKNAEKAFMKIKPDTELFEKIMSALKSQKENWHDPKYIPHAATWLNGNRWDDEVDVKCRRGEIRSNELAASEPTHDEKIQHKKNLIAQYGENFKLWPEKWGPMLEKLKAELLELESEQDQ